MHQDAWKFDSVALSLDDATHLLAAIPNAHITFTPTRIAAGWRRPDKLDQILGLFFEAKTSTIGFKSLPIQRLNHVMYLSLLSVLFTAMKFVQSISIYCTR